ncbi:MAG: carboxylesterase family protein, partial [Blautia sp.]|nr:carboxylesterase family protein [Blautia sp.]
HGIPFALPPVGGLRWRPPVPVAASKDVYEAIYNGSSPIQTILDSERASKYHQSEDCLYLNVWTAKDYRDSQRPVMVFIHGGNYGWGGTADPLYDGHCFVSAHPEIVLVTIAYRTGIAGFINFSEVPGGESYKGSGNLGLLDQICALRWIQANIQAFGGDPTCVTIFGESAGGGSVSLLPLIKEARGLFSRVIAQSGSVALTYSTQECLPFTRTLLKETGAKTMEDLLSLTEEQLSKANQVLNNANNFPERDGILLPEDLYGAYDRGEASPVQMMIGTNADELRYWIQDVGGIKKYQMMSHVLLENNYKRMSFRDQERIEEFLHTLPDIKGRPWQITEFYNEIMFRLPAIRQAQAHAAYHNPVYMYYWAYPSSLPNMGACHAVELAYVFNNLSETIYTGEGIYEPLAIQAQQMWVNFAKTGNPSLEDLTWEPYSQESRGTMILDKESHMQWNLKEEAREKLMPILDYRLNGNYADLSLNVPFVRKILAGVVGLTVGVTLIIKQIFKR